MLSFGLIAIFTLLALVHVYWAFGGQVAKVAAIPELRGTPTFLPGRMATLLVAAALFACAALVGTATGLIDRPVSALAVQRVCFGLSLLLLLRAIGDFRLLGFFKKVRGSRFAWLDSVLYSPLCLLLALGVLLVGWQAAA
jgi:hypothetical protein